MEDRQLFAAYRGKGTADKRVKEVPSDFIKAGKWKDVICAELYCFAKGLPTCGLFVTIATTLMPFR
jgi:hypothetical protein